MKDQYIKDIASGKRVITPRMRRKQRYNKAVGYAKKTASAVGKGAKSFGKDLVETGKVVYRDIKPKKVKIKRYKVYRKKGKRFIPVYKKSKKKFKKVSVNTDPFGLRYI